MNKLFVLVGPSAAGKTLISNYLVSRDLSIFENLINTDLNLDSLTLLDNLNIINDTLKPLLFKRIITSTSRTARENETHGVDYFFYSSETFKEKINNGDFLEYVENFGNYYGTSLDSIHSSLKLGHSIIVLDDKGAIKMKDLLKDSVITIYLDVPIYVMEKRMNIRNDDTSSLKKRITNLDIINYKEKADFIVDASRRIDDVLLALIDIIKISIS